MEATSKKAAAMRAKQQKGRDDVVGEGNTRHSQTTDPEMRTPRILGDDRARLSQSVDQEHDLVLSASFQATLHPAPINDLPRPAGPLNDQQEPSSMNMASSKSSFDAFAEVDKIVSKPVLGSDGAASWQEFKKDAKLNSKESVAPALQVKRADRLATGFQSLAEERGHEAKVRAKAGDSEVGSGYTVFKRKNNAEEAAQQKRRKRIEQRIRPDDKPYFLPAKSFQGWKFDYVFTTRDSITGYYWDGTDSVKKLNGIVVPEEQSVATKSVATNDEVKAEEPIQQNEETEKKKKRKKDKAKGTVIVSDPNNPMEQVAEAIRRRNQANNGLPSLRAKLPDGWEMAVDQSSGRIYYFNRAKGLQQWVPPDDLPDGWKSATDPNGKTYYYHKKGETRWEKPLH